jgi:hypothetical protein
MLHLSDAVFAVEELIRGFEADLVRQFPDESPSMADVFTVFSLTPLR